MRTFAPTLLLALGLHACSPSAAPPGPALRAAEGPQASQGDTTTAAGAPREPAAELREEPATAAGAAGDGPSPGPAEPPSRAHAPDPQPAAERAAGEGDARAALEAALQAAWQDTLLSSDALGLDPSDPPGFALVTRRELRDLITEENLPLLARQLGGEAQARPHARQFGRALSAVLIAKYDNLSGRVVVQVDNLLRNAAMDRRAGLLEPEAMRALLLHELVHAADDRRFGLLATMQALESPEQIEAFDAVLEGHAQFVARREAARRGWQRGFETYTALFTAPAADLEELPAALRAMAEMIAATMASKYTDGEAFFEALHARLGSEAAAHAFHRPPRDMAELLEPSWYLDPETRPRLAVDLDGGLDEIAALLDDLGWVHRRASISAVQLRTLSELLPEQQRSVFMRAARHNRMVVAGHPEDPSLQFAAGLYLADSEADAAALLAALEAITRERDRRLGEDDGPEAALRLLSAEYTPEVEDGWRELAIAKTLAIRGEESRLLMWMGQHGRLVVETMDVGSSLAAEALRAMGLTLARHALGIEADRSESGEAPEPQPEPTPEPEPEPR